MSGKLADDLGLVPDNHISLYEIFQFSDVPRPGVLHHAADGIIAESGRVLSVEIAVLALKEVQQDGDFLAPFPQRRDVNGHHV